MSIFAALALLVCAHLVASDRRDFCTLHNLPSTTTYLQFTKEPVPFEYGLIGHFKSIHCCVKGYRSIEWFKDDVPYPWPAGVSNFILYPEDANQTLYVQRSSLFDGGDYTCRVSNQTHTQEHLIRLEILNKQTDSPKTMYVSEDQWVEEGKPLRLFCEVLIGKTILADARSDLRWRKVWPNGTEGDLLPTQKEINTSRDDVQNIFGSYVMMDNVTPEDYGKYVCVVHSNSVESRHYVTVLAPTDLMLYDAENQTTPFIEKGGVELAWRASEVPWRTLVLCMAGIVLTTLTAVAVHRRFTPHLRLLARALSALVATPAQRARVLEKEFDVLVCWTPIDRELVRGALLPTLQLKYKYRVHGVQVAAEPDNWYRDLLPECARCRALVAVVSPTQHSPVELLAALRQLRALPLPPVVVLLQDLPDLKREAKDSGETLVNVLRRTKLVPWRRMQDGEFWMQLRLALPMPPVQPAAPETDSAMAAVTLADTDTSRSGSMTALV